MDLRCPKKKNGLTYQESAENWIVYLPLNKKEAFYEKGFIEKLWIFLPIFAFI